MHGLTDPMILVIDADSVSLAAIAAALQGKDYQVCAASDADQALAAARQCGLDLLICDVNLKGDDGMALVEAIRALPDRGDVPVMFMSSAQISDVAYRSFGQSSAYFLRKPLDPRLLFDVIEKALWMPHLVKSHVNRPHIPLGATPSPAIPVFPVSPPTVGV